MEFFNWTANILGQAYVIIEAIEIFHDERPESVRVSYNEKTKESSIKLLK